MLKEEFYTRFLKTHQHTLLKAGTILVLANTTGNIIDHQTTDNIDSITAPTDLYSHAVAQHTSNDNRFLRATRAVIAAIPGLHDELLNRSQQKERKLIQNTHEAANILQRMQHQSPTQEFLEYMAALNGGIPLDNSKDYASFLKQHADNIKAAAEQLDNFKATPNFEMVSMNLER